MSITSFFFRTSSIWKYSSIHRPLLTHSLTHYLLFSLPTIMFLNWNDNFMNSRHAGPSLGIVCMIIGGVACVTALHLVVYVFWHQAGMTPRRCTTSACYAYCKLGAGDAQHDDHHDDDDDDDDEKQHHGRDNHSFQSHESSDVKIYRQGNQTVLLPKLSSS